jgi:SRSO17 transposase
VRRQYTGSAGKITNCQVGVFAAYVSTRGHALIDRHLYLPKAWTDSPERRAAAHVPEDVTFAPRLAVAMIERAIGAGVPFSWVASVYGVGGVEMALRRAGKGYVLGVASTTQVHSWDKPVAGTAEAIALALPLGPPAPGDPGFTTGLIWNWPTSMRGPSSTVAPLKRCGRC